MFGVTLYIVLVLVLLWLISDPDAQTASGSRVRSGTLSAEEFQAMKQRIAELEAEVNQFRKDTNKPQPLEMRIPQRSIEMEPQR